jgi:hypothetical protein
LLSGTPFPNLSCAYNPKNAGNVFGGYTLVFSYMRVKSSVAKLSKQKQNRGNQQNKTATYAVHKWLFSDERETRLELATLSLGS